MIRYLVTCPHDGELGHVGEIVDARAEGRGVTAEDFRSHGTPVTPRNRLGSRRTMVFGCGTCELQSPPLADTTIADVLDALARATSVDPGRVSGPIGMPIYVPTANIYEVLFDGAEQEWTTTGEQGWHLLTLKTLCDMVTGLRDRGRH